MTFEQLNNPATYDLAELKPRYGIGGSDLSSTTDLTCGTVIFMVPGDNTIYVMQMYWLPEDLLEQRVKEDKILTISGAIWGSCALCQEQCIRARGWWFWKYKTSLIFTSPGTVMIAGLPNIMCRKDYFGKDGMEPVIQGKDTERPDEGTGC